MKPTIAVLIPCFNESVTIAKVIGDFRTVLPECTVFVYDNNSTDGTAELARNCGAVVRHEPQQGKGNVVRAVRGERIGTLVGRNGHGRNAP